MTHLLAFSLRTATLPWRNIKLYPFLSSWFIIEPIGASTNLSMSKILIGFLIFFALESLSLYYIDNSTLYFPVLQKIQFTSKMLKTTSKWKRHRQNIKLHMILKCLHFEIHCENETESPQSLSTWDYRWKQPKAKDS